MKLTLQRGALAAGALIVGLLVNRILPAPEAIQIALDDAVAATETNDVGRIMQHVSDDFRGSVGGEIGDEATVTIVVALWRGGLGGQHQAMPPPAKSSSISAWREPTGRWSEVGSAKRASRTFSEPLRSLCLVRDRSALCKRATRQKRLTTRTARA
jgi:hypothetical protein